MSISAAIQALEASSLKELLVVPSKDEYGLRNRSYLHQIQREIMPAAIFLPRNKEQISQFVRIIKPFALSGAAPFAIRGAGQQPLPGCSNVDGGITVDLHYLTGITVKRERIEVAAGERWGNVHERLASEGLAVTGSRYAAGGIGGVALTGGISIFSSREGMICDNVISYEVVLASGEIVNANEHERPDLWRALRGGGNNFGIVTRYDFRPFEQGNFWSGHVLYSPLGFPSQIDALVRELRSPCVSDETHIEISIGHSTASAKPRRFLCVNNLYFTRVVGRPVLLEPFLQVRHQIKLLNLERMQSLEATLSRRLDFEARWACMNTTVQADASTLDAAYCIFTRSISLLDYKMDLLTCDLMFRALPVSLLERCHNSLGLTAADGPLVSIVLRTCWKNKEDDENVIRTFKRILEEIEIDADLRGTAHPFKDMSLAHDFQDPINSYGLENREKLRKVSLKYDPEGLFQKGVPGGFKLFNHK